MRNRKTIWLIVLTLIFSAFACNMPQATPAPNAAPTDAGFQAPTQPGVEETEAPGKGEAQPAETTPQPPASGTAGEDKRLTLGTTSYLVDSGLLEQLLSPFRNNSGYEVIVESGGAGRVLKLGEKSVVDVLFINEPGSEQKFIDDGFGRDRMPVMYADYIIVGPADDPASVKASTNAVDAFKRIAGAQAKFITRSGSQGAQGVETKLWKAAEITPQGDWYILSEEGPVGTLKIASDKQGYAVIDRATFLENKDKFTLEVLYEGDTRLRDMYHVLTVNPDRADKINYPASLAWAQYLTSPEAQAIIQQFAVDRYGQPIFFPANQP